MTIAKESYQQGSVSPVAAALLSLVVPGFGHIYLGRRETGLALLVAHVSLGSLATLAVTTGLSSLSTVAIVATSWCILWFSATVWAYRTAQSLSTNPLPRQKYPVYLYLLVGLLVLPNALGWVLAIRANVAEVFMVPSPSMLPSIKPGSRVVVNKLIYRHSSPKRGDLVVFTNPNARHAKYIKRVVALPGDVVEMRDDELIVNGRRLDYLDSGMAVAQGKERIEVNGEARYRILLGPADPMKLVPNVLLPLKVPNGHCFVLGDNRHQSEDSRLHGAVPLVDVVGVVQSVF
jgi:signal peptidase I